MQRFVPHRRTSSGKWSRDNTVVYDRILFTRVSSHDHLPDEVRRWRTKCRI